MKICEVEIDKALIRYLLMKIVADLTHDEKNLYLMTNSENNGR